MSDLRICGPFTAFTGYSHMARAVVASALKAGFKVQAVESDYRTKYVGMTDGRLTWSRIYMRPSYPIPQCQAEEIRKAKRTKIPLSSPTLFIQIPDSLEGWHEYSSGPRIGWTMCESDRLNPRWKDALTSVDMLLAPSRYVLDTFRRDVPSVRSELVPLPVDDRLWTPAPNGTPFARKNLPGFIFFSIFNSVERKNWRLMVQAFGEEFAGEDVGLIIKPSDWRPVSQLASWMNSLNRLESGEGLFVEVIRDRLTDEQVADYYRMCDCFVLPSAEGFGLPLVEAALCGKASVALDGGGAADIVNERTGYPVPHVMKPCIGQIPHCYPSSHLFPTCEIEPLKKAMRAAYEDKGRKGDAALLEAKRRFTPQAISREILPLIEESYSSHKKKIRIWNRPNPPQYALVIGEGYGDAMASYGNALHVLGTTASYDVDFLHYGYSKGVREWLSIQPRIKKVTQIEPEDKETFQKIANKAGGFYGRPLDSWIPKILEGMGIDPASVAPTHVHWPWGAWEVHRPDRMKLSKDAEQWAEKTKAELGEFILVQPYSISSVGYAEHWFYWPPFLQWLIARCSGIHKLVFCGQEKIHGLKGEHVIDMIGQTPSMQHVLALANLSKGVISTCNALANWTAITGTPGLIARNAAIPNDFAYWGRFMRTPNNMLMPYECGLEDMENAGEKWLNERAK